MSDDHAHAILTEFVSSLDNLPSEISFLLLELEAKDVELIAVRHKAVSRDGSIQRYPAKQAQQAGNGAQATLMSVNPKEGELTEAVRAGWERIAGLQREKNALAQRALKLVSKHLQRLDTELTKHSIVLPVLSVPPPPSSSSHTTTATTSHLLTSHSHSHNNPFVPSSLLTPTTSTSFSSPVPAPPSLYPFHNAHRPTRPSRLSSSVLAHHSHAHSVQQGRNKRRKNVDISELDLDDDGVDEDLDEPEDGEADGEGDVDMGDGGADDGKLYCLCRKVSSGTMVGCDSDECEYEWFHLSCVGLVEEPKDENWLCPPCQAKKAQHALAMAAGGGGGQGRKGQKSNGGGRRRK